MREQLRAYICCLFAGALETPENRDLQEEILQNSMERYDDLVREGKAPAEAYNLTISGIGDVGAILAGTGSAPAAPVAPTVSISPDASTASAAPVAPAAPTCDPSGMPAEQPPVYASDNRQPLSRLMLAGAVCLYITCVVPVILNGGTLGVCLMFVMIALATALILMRPRPAAPQQATPEEDKPQDPRHELKKAISGTVSVVILALYFLLSFSTGAWYITWVLFPIGGAVSGLIHAIMDLMQ